MPFAMRIPLILLMLMPWTFRPPGAEAQVSRDAGETDLGMELRPFVRVALGFSVPAGQFRTPHGLGLGKTRVGGYAGAEVAVPFSTPRLAWTISLRYLAFTAGNELLSSSPARRWNMLPLLGGLTLRGRLGSDMNLFVQALTGPVFIFPPRIYRPSSSVYGEVRHEFRTALGFALEAGFEFHPVTWTVRVLDCGSPEYHYLSVNYSGRISENTWSQSTVLVMAGIGVVM